MSTNVFPNHSDPTDNDFGLSDHQLDQHIEEVDLFYLAKCFGPWTIYTGIPGLQLTRGDQHTITADPNLVNNQMRMKEGLVIWRNSNPLSATFRNLILIVLKLEEEDVAIEISNYIKCKLLLEEMLF